MRHLYAHLLACLIDLASLSAAAGDLMSITLATAGPGTLSHLPLATRQDVLEKTLEKTQRMVRVMYRTLQWIAAHSPQEIADRLGVMDEAEQQKAHQNPRTPQGHLQPARCLHPRAAACGRNLFATHPMTKRP